MTLHKILLYTFILIGFYFSSRVEAFSYPTQPATPERKSRLNENLQVTYNNELREIKKEYKGKLNTPEQSAYVSLRIQARNRDFYKALQKEPVPEVGKNVPHVDLHQAQEIFSKIENHPVVGDLALSKYDSEGLNIGFCFGRAAYVHLEFLRRGIHPKSIAKIFAIGDFRFNRNRWDFHVTTIVRGPKGDWWTIDSVLNKKVEPVEIWMEEVKKIDKNPKQPKVRFYFADAVKFQPIFGAYDSRNLYFPFFKNFFVDLATWFDAHPASAFER